MLMGYLTDGGLWYRKMIKILKRFDVKDGLSINLLQEAGIEIVLISGGESTSAELSKSIRN